MIIPSWPPGDDIGRWVLLSLGALILVIGVVGLIGEVVMRRRPAPPQPGATTTGDHSPAIVGDGNIIGDRNVVANLSVRVPENVTASTAVNQRLEAGQQLLQEIRDTPNNRLTWQFDEVHLPRVLAWHSETAQVIRDHFPASHARYDSEASIRPLTARGTNIPSDLPVRLRADTEGFLKDRMHELRGLLG